MKYQDLLTYEERRHVNAVNMCTGAIDARAVLKLAAIVDRLAPPPPKPATDEELADKVALVMGALDNSAEKRVLETVYDALKARSK